MSKLALIVTGNGQHFEIPYDSFEVAVDKFEDYDLVINLDYVGDNSVNKKTDDSVLVAWDAFSEKVKFFIKNHPSFERWNSVSFEKVYAAKLQELCMTQFREGKQEINIALNVMFQEYLHNDDAVVEASSVIEEKEFIDEFFNEKEDDKDSEVNKPSPRGIVIDELTEIPLSEAVAISDINALRDEKRIKLATADIIESFSSSDVVLKTLNTKMHIMTDLEKAIKELISIEYFHSKDKVLHIVIPPKIIFEKNEKSKDKVIYIIEGVKIYAESKR